jgi:biopolymer transport protein ExbD
LGLTDPEMKKFSIIETFGTPYSELKQQLNKNGEDLMKQEGIPTDSMKNELIGWIGMAKNINPKLRIAIKADRKTDYKDAHKVINTLQSLNLNRMSFITNLEGAE